MSMYIFTKMKGHGIKLNLIVKPVPDGQFLNSIQCTPTYCNPEPASSIITVGLRHVAAKKTIIPAKTRICQVQIANNVH